MSRQQPFIPLEAWLRFIVTRRQDWGLAESGPVSFFHNGAQIVFFCRNVPKNATQHKMTVWLMGFSYSICRCVMSVLPLFHTCFIKANHMHLLIPFLLHNKADNVQWNRQSSPVPKDKVLALLTLLQTSATCHRLHFILSLLQNVSNHRHITGLWPDFHNGWWRRWCWRYRRDCWQATDHT